MLFAGLYESWYPEKKRPEVTFTIVTCAANAAIAEIHDRMPVGLDERAADDGMNPRERDPLSLKRLLIPAPDDLLPNRPASPLVKNVKNDSRTPLDLERQQKFSFCLLPGDFQVPGARLWLNVLQGLSHGCIPIVYL